MNPDRWREIESLFDRATTLPLADRRQFLDSSGTHDATVKAEVWKLLEAHDSRHPLLDAPKASRLPKGVRLGAYEVDAVLGSGGMATVYLAHRADRQFEKQVAIKVVTGLQVAVDDARFRTERGILAALEHPHIARLLDSGINEFGQPFLVMELVDGKPLDVWSTGATLEQRLDVWLQVASAVAYAHRSLVIHRDLKPSNVLVSSSGDAKLLDFGIAKLLTATGTDSGAPTVTATQAYTPLYASPEQILGKPVTTATDIYSLGVILFELMTGRHPHWVEGRSAHEVAEHVLRGETAIPPDVPADMAAIVSMAMRKDPARRYTTVDQFAEDIRRYRRGLPVIAQPETVAYRARKFVSRHRVGVAAAAVFVLMAAGAVGLILRQVRIATAERDRANLETRKTGQINAFLQNMLSSADPLREGRDVKVVDVLNRAGERLTRELQGQPEIEGDLRATLASTYQSLGVFDTAVDNARQALELRRRVFGADSVAVARSQIALGSALNDRGNYNESEAPLREGLSALDRLGLSESLDAADGLHHLGALLNETDRYPEGEQTHRRAVALYRRLLPEPANDERMGRALDRMAENLGYQQRFNEAEPLHREALAIMRRVRGADDLGISPMLHNLAGALDTMGHFDEAERLYREALALELKYLEETHNRVTLTRTSLANMFWMKHDYGQAESFARAALAIGPKGLPEGHPLIAYAHIVLGQTLVDAGRPAEAEPHLRTALEMRKKLLPAGHWLIANTESVLGGAVAATGRYQDAEPLLLGSYQRLLKDRGPDTDKTRDARRRLAELYRAWGRPADAAKYSGST